jgi:hypothetical protein
MATSAAPARADDAEAARKAYDRGASAYDSGDFAVAAAELGRADELLANDVALELALKAAVKADDALAAIALVARAERRTRTGTLGAAAAAAREKMAGRTGAVTVLCRGWTSCTATLDGKDIPVGQRQLALTGAHRVVVQGAGGPRETLSVRVEPEGAVDVSPSPPAAAPPALAPSLAREPSPARPSGISPAWFWVGVGLTAVVSGAAVASAADTRSKHDEFQTNPSTALQRDGLDAQLRTNLLVGGAGASAIVTTILGLVFVRWSAGPGTPPGTAAQARF